MQEPTSTPFNWIIKALGALTWPVICGAAFWLGRYMERLEARVTKAETSIQALVERHLPAVHRALADLRGLLTSMKKSGE